MNNRSRETKRVAFKSIGCRTNQEEMTALCGDLLRKGYSVLDSVHGADIIVVNTCSVTAGTEAKTRRMLHALTLEAPQARILVTGCLAQQKPAMLQELPQVQWVVGNQFKQQISSILDGGSTGLFHAPLAGSEPLDIIRGVVPPGALQGGRTRFSVKIQEGCNFACAYCIVPLLRGPSRSAAYNEVIARCREAVAAGYKEIVLTGTHIGQYNDRQQYDFLALVDTIIALPGDFRLRLSSIDPRDCSPALLERIAGSNNVCDHLHVSLQSGSAAVLRAMGRSHEDIEPFMAMLIAFRSAYSHVGIGVDIIVGFPGETDEQFAETCRGVTDLAVSYAHVFRFSSRPGTVAASLPDQVAESVKKARSNRLREIVAASRARFVATCSKIPLRIIVESSCPIRGVTSNYLHVEIPNSDSERNRWLDISIDGTVQGRYCLAQPLRCEVV